MAKKRKKLTPKQRSERQIEANHLRRLADNTFYVRRRAQSIALAKKHKALAKKKGHKA